MIETGTRKNTRRKTVRVAILTPYLYESMEHMLERAPDMEWAIAQVTMFGQVPNNLSGIKYFNTSRFKVELVSPDITDGTRTHTDCLIDPTVVFSVAGSAPKAEDRILNYRDSGLVVGRYSIFYGRNSEYTNRSAAEGGYSFDIPKDVETVKGFLTCDSVLESIAKRNEASIVKAVTRFNKNREYPIIITPFLHQTLQNKRNGGS